MYNTSKTMGCIGCGMGAITANPYRKGTPEYFQFAANQGAETPGLIPDITGTFPMVGGTKASLGPNTRIVADSQTGKVDVVENLPPVEEEEKILGMPKNYVYIGGAAVAVGMIWYFTKK